MAKKFRALIENMPAERKQRIAQRTVQLMDEVPIQELRKALQLTQQQVAITLSINQASVLNITSQTDVYVDTLRRFIAAMGGNLRIVAHFPQGDVEIDKFTQAI